MTQGFESTQITGMRRGTSRYPRYDSAVLGFEGFWYPVMFARDLHHKPVSLRLFGQEIMFYRDRGVAHALQDRCPHRGIPLSLGKQEFPGTFTCRYHGWTFDLESGTMVAALTDGPDSPMCGKARARIYPVAERAGILWIYNGTGTPPPVERDIPVEFLRSDAVIEGRIAERPGDWRHGAENGFDESHGKYLHRDAWMVFFRHQPAYITTVIGPDDEPWVTRKTKTAAFFGDFPGLGTWPKKRFWKTTKGGAQVSIRLPGTLRVHYTKWIHFEWYVPTVPGEHRYLQFVLKHASGPDALLFRVRYWLHLRWIFHVHFNNQDAKVVRLMTTPPEQLFRPDHSIIAWRRMCEQVGAENDRGFVTPEAIDAALEREMREQLEEV
jgi:phenylpropionate dioxygenase-like ring-hydroxylating dioxygenase large terminal subunit